MKCKSPKNDGTECGHEEADHLAFNPGHPLESGCTICEECDRFWPHDSPRVAKDAIHGPVVGSKP
jgi:hypothetical protein